MRTYEDGDYLVVEDVPILDEHTLRDDDGKPVMRVSAKMLREIARTNNQRIQQTGDECPLVVGHTKDEAPESQQPEVVGYASNYRVKRLLETTRQAIHATFRFFKDKLDTVRKFPRRSVEFWLSDKKIDPIALLGATTPERDLGLLRLSKSGKKSYRRTINHVLKLEKTVPDDTNNAKNEGTRDVDSKMVDAIFAKITQTDVWKWVESQMSQDEGGDDDAVMVDDVGLDDEYDDYDDEGMDPMGANGPPGMPGDEPPMFDDDDEDPARYSAGYGSGSNTYLPSMRRNRRMPRNPTLRGGARPADTRKLRRTQEQQSIQLSRTQRALFSTAQQVEDLKLQLRKSSREKDLIQLEAEGIVFDRDEELNDCAEMSEGHYQRHLQRLRKRYSRAPIGGDWYGTHARPPSPTGGTDKSTMQQIVDYAAEKGVSYAEAKAALTGESTF